MTTLQQQIDELKTRNRKVETNKARETSWTRKISIAIITYILVVIFLSTAGNSSPFLNALVPTAWFLLSTLSLDIVKNIWEKFLE